MQGVRGPRSTPAAFTPKSISFRWRFDRLGDRDALEGPVSATDQKGRTPHDFIHFRLETSEGQGLLQIRPRSGTRSVQWTISAPWLIHQAA